MKAIFVVAVVLAAFAYTSEAVQCPRHNEDDVVLLPNPEDCQSYYTCNEGIAYLMRCSVGLEFNPVERVCDWPEHANCESRVSTTDASQETTVSTEEPEISTITEEPEIGTTEESASEKFEMFFD